jgi:16S rRNA (cytidine1402-2'-O)-methyltransferase
LSTLYVVATPIGNLSDLSQRAIETLRTVDRVLAEDTRRSRGLLSHLGISGKPVQRLDAHASPAELEAVARAIAAGESAALVTDAGAPGVSDPGAGLIRAALAAGVSIVPIPGPSAVTTAVSLAEFVSGPFAFLGFVPRQASKRNELIERLARAEEPVVLFESPERIAATLSELASRLPERRALLCRELTKLHEETLRGTLRELAALEREWLGEITFVVEGVREDELAARAPSQQAIDQEIGERLAAGESTRDVADDMASRLGLPRRELYERALRLKS